MKLYAFRGIDNEGKPSGWYGFAVAANAHQLFWQINQHIDPFRVEIQKLDSASVLFRTKTVDDGDGPPVVVPDHGEAKTEICEEMEQLLDFEQGWKKPRWKPTKDKAGRSS